MQNEDDQCFKWSVTRALNFKEIPTVKELRQLAKEWFERIFRTQ